MHNTTIQNRQDGCQPSDASFVGPWFAIHRTLDAWRCGAPGCLPAKSRPPRQESSSLPIKRLCRLHEKVRALPRKEERGPPRKEVLTLPHGKGPDRQHLLHCLGAGGLLPPLCPVAKDLLAGKGLMDDRDAKKATDY